MIKTAASEIKARFATVQKKHLERWDRENPVPSKPATATVLRELKAGKFTVDADSLENELNAKRDWGHVAFTDVITTVSFAKYETAIKERADDRTRFEEELQEAKDGYLDRVLFDHENGFLLLRDFQKWRGRERAAGVAL